MKAVRETWRTQAVETCCLIVVKLFSLCSHLCTVNFIVSLNIWRPLSVALEHFCNRYASSHLVLLVLKYASDKNYYEQNPILNSPPKQHASDRVLEIWRNLDMSAITSNEALAGTGRIRNHDWQSSFIFGSLPSTSSSLSAPNFSCPYATVSYLPLLFYFPPLLSPSLEPRRQLKI